MLNSLDERFDDHLAQAENLSALFVALNDEVFEIREMAICMIGRLSSKNPAYVMPSLRKTLIQVRSLLYRFTTQYCLLTIYQMSFLDWTKFKAFAEDKLNVAKIMISAFDQIENIVEKGENAGY